jgi:hypothetical protein
LFICFQQTLTFNNYLKKNLLKKKLFFLAAVLGFIIFAPGCKKSDTQPTPTNTTIVGTWVGTGQYGTGAGSPTYPLTLTFKANGTVDIIGNNSTATDNATGTWQLTGDVLTAAYRYSASTADYTLSGRFSASLTTVAGTIGLGTATTGIGLFSVTKQ